METIIKDGKEKAVNLYARRNNGRFDRIVMCNEETLTFESEPHEVKYGNWFAIAWPLNPHFTGEGMIMQMLNDIDFGEINKLERK